MARMNDRPQTLRDLKASGYRSRPVKQELRENLIARLRAGQLLFPGILGYEETVIPQIINAVLSQHDMLFLGLRGQGKTRMLRMLPALLDEWLPIVAGSEIHDDPFAPLSKKARDRILAHGDDTPIEWVGREDRYHEKLATPDVTIADLIGEIDLIKHAGGKELSNEDVMHFGLIPRSHRGIFCINELPDLAPKIQVGLFNVLEERDIQIRGFSVRLPLDLCLVFSANPEDYTNRGRIVTPLKDRIGSVIRTHYPVSRDLGVQIMEENALADRPHGVRVHSPRFMKEIVEEASRLARVSPHVNQASGVSVRMSVANYENVLSNAERRGILQGLTEVVARPVDLTALAAGSRGKVELALTDESGEEDLFLTRLVEEAIKNIFDLKLSPKTFASVIEVFNSGKKLEIGDGVQTDAFLKEVDSIKNFRKQVEALATEWEPEIARSSAGPELQVAIAELILEGLYSHNKVNKKRKGGISAFGL